MAKPLLWKIVQNLDHRWRSPLNQKEDVTRPVIKGWVGEAFYPFSRLVLVPPIPSSSASRPPVAPNPAPLPLDSEVDLMNFDWCAILVIVPVSLCTPIKDIKFISCFHLSKGAFGNKNGLWVLTLLGWCKKHRLIGVSSQIGFARESLGEPLNFQVVAIGSQQWQISHSADPRCRIIISNLWRLYSQNHYHILMISIPGPFSILQGSILFAPNLWPTPGYPTPLVHSVLTLFCICICIWFIASPHFYNVF